MYIYSTETCLLHVGKAGVFDDGIDEVTVDRFSKECSDVLHLLFKVLLEVFIVHKHDIRVVCVFIPAERMVQNVSVDQFFNLGRGQRTDPRCRYSYRGEFIW